VITADEDDGGSGNQVLTVVAAPGPASIQFRGDPGWPWSRTSTGNAGGHTHDGAVVLDLTTAAGARCAVGEVIATATEQAIGTLTGFENHQGRTTLGPDARPLAVVERGVGNGVPHAGRAVEGVQAGSVIGTYLHGPVLARNPTLADHLLTLATGLDLPPLELPDQEPMRRGYLQPRRRGFAARLAALLRS